MAQLIDLTGETFGFLVVQSIASRKPVAWNCTCACGKNHVASSGNLKGGGVKSCGCKMGELLVASRGSHGMSKSSEFHSWASMKARFLNKNLDWYKRYGGRGITVCERWLNSFENFLEDMGTKPTPLHEIERKDNNGNYEPSNCKWATPLEQQNNKRNNHRVDYRGQSFTISQLSRLCGIRKDTLRLRLKRMSPELAVNTPVKS